MQRWGASTQMMLGDDAVNLSQGWETQTSHSTGNELEVELSGQGEMDETVALCSSVKADGTK